MDFPLFNVLDEEACYRRLVELLHPNGLACPGCKQNRRLGVHRHRRAPILDYQCGACGRVFNAFTNTVLHGTRYSPRTLVLILHGFVQGTPTAQLARELGCDRMHLLSLRHRMQEHARQQLDHEPLSDTVVEADETYQNAGEKRNSAPRSGRPAKAPSQSAARTRHL